ncbi:unnamed protein product, partial [Ectocarpus sp. 12 AP-2014]
TKPHITQGNSGSPPNCLALATSSHNTLVLCWGSSPDRQRDSGAFDARVQNTGDAGNTAIEKPSGPFRRPSRELRQWMPVQCLSEDIAAAPVPMDVTPTQRMISACAGVLATSLVVTPMDVVKTRVQAAQAEYVSQQTASSLNTGRCGNENCHQCAAPQGRTYTTSARATLAGFDGTATSTARLALEAAKTAAPPPRARIPALPTGTVAALMHIARWEGPRGLYRGLDASLVMAIPSTVLYY